MGGKENKKGKTQQLFLEIEAENLRKNEKNRRKRGHKNPVKYGKFKDYCN